VCVCVETQRSPDHRTSCSRRFVREKVAYIGVRACVRQLLSKYTPPPPPPPPRKHAVPAAGRAPEFFSLGRDRHSLLTGADGMNNTRSWPTSRTPSRRRDGEYVEMGILQLAAGDYQSSSGRARLHWSRVRGARVCPQHLADLPRTNTPHPPSRQSLSLSLSLSLCLPAHSTPTSIHTPSATTVVVNQQSQAAAANIYTERKWAENYNK